MLAPTRLAAAHSMDTDWFAVDDDGHVAIMYSGEPGCAPAGVAQFFTDEQQASLESDVAPRESVVELAEPSWTWLIDESCPVRLEQRGYFLFTASAQWRSAGYYDRSVRPLQPLRASELPAAIAGSLVRLEGARFAEMPVVQPADFAPMKHWMPHWVSLRTWRLEARDAERRAPDLFELRRDGWVWLSEEHRALEVDAAALVAFTLDNLSLFDPDRTAQSLVERYASLTRAALTKDEFAALEAALASRDDDAERVVEAIVRDLRARSAERPLWAPLPALDEPAPGQDRHGVVRAANEELVARGQCDPSWLRDESRRYLCTSDEWHDGATRADLGNPGSIHFAMTPPAVLAALAKRATDVLAAESIAREAARDRGADARTVYWRAATPAELAFAMARAEDERGRALSAMGFAMDPVIERVPTLLVERPSEPFAHNPATATG